MKNKVLIGSLITALIAFMLYSVNLKKVENSSLKIVGQGQEQIVKNKKEKNSVREPKVATVEYPNHIKIASGSEQKWAEKIVQVMGKDQSYQVCVQDLNNNKYARVSNTSQRHGVNTSSRLFLLIALTYQEQHGKSVSKKAIKIKKADHVKGEKVLQKGIAYNAAYLKQLMMQGDKTAANALLRTVKPATVNSIIKKIGVHDTTIKGKFSAKPAALTTANDLNKIMVSLYHDQILSRQYSNQVLGALNANKTKPRIIRNSKGLIYAIGDSKANVALVQSNGNAYCVSVWGNNDHDFVKLGKAVNSFFK
ncbi:serine hydrolase [Lactobacillus sp. ESL0261]|uniref:serine hydrolase n=1 Tax=Lactobacillus sp. ESL0261 TaxID=2069348 RepID=UPI000EFCDACE|nr:serine hydrolase [Lactobacillus sp. ESL0261]MBC6370756.1 serine hydrolase [Lactobacillus kullabergensis]RMC56976.1 serine hydrolase [Lactobacillus sp. ESL0261]